jgi:hypothetical protein
VEYWISAADKSLTSSHLCEESRIFYMVMLRHFSKDQTPISTQRNLFAGTLSHSPSKNPPLTNTLI